MVHPVKYDFSTRVIRQVILHRGIVTIFPIADWCIYIIYWKYSDEELFDQNDDDQIAGIANTQDQSKDLILSIFKNHV